MLGLAESGVPIMPEDKMNDTDDLALIEKAKAGSRQALEEVVGLVQDRVYGLALRMLHSPSDAEDATQEVLIKLITKLDSFRGEGKFINWVLRIASNHIISFRRSRAERNEITLADAQAHMDKNYANAWQESDAKGYQALVVEEARISCLHAMLITLDRAQRLALILGVVFGVSSQEGAYILDITPAAFRKRLSRARGRIKDFMSANCALVNRDNPCTCARSIAWRRKSGWMYKKGLVFTTHPNRGYEGPALDSYFEELDEMRKVSALFRATPRYAAPFDFKDTVKKMIDSGSYQVFN